jgi:P27 family predicted phage terminase small subunit
MPVLNATSIEAPATLTQPAVQRWNTIIPALLNAKIVAQQDIPMLEEAFILMGEYFDALEEINKIKTKKKLTEIDLKKRMKINAWMIRSITACNSILCRFGVGPSERAKLTSLAMPGEEKELDALDILLEE